MGGYWKVVNKTRDAAIAVLKDTPENIFKRITFYDVDSRPIQKNSDGPRETALPRTNKARHHLF